MRSSTDRKSTEREVRGGSVGDERQSLGPHARRSRIAIALGVHLTVLVAGLAAGGVELALVLLEVRPVPPRFVGYVLAANVLWCLALAVVERTARALARAAGLGERPPGVSGAVERLRWVGAVGLFCALFGPLATLCALAIDEEVRTPLYRALSISGALLALVPLALLPSAALYATSRRGLSALGRRGARRAQWLGGAVAVVGVVAIGVLGRDVLERIDFRPALSLLPPLVVFALVRWLVSERLTSAVFHAGAGPRARLVTIALLVAALLPLALLPRARGAVVSFAWESALVAHALPAPRPRTRDGGDRLARLFPKVPPHAPRRAARNLLLISVDALRPDHLGIYGYERNTSPHLDELFADATRIERCYTVIPGTIPAVVSLHTGVYPYRLPWVTPNERVTSRATTLAERLKAQGFTTTYVNYMLYITKRGGLDQGFDEVVVNPVTAAGTRTPKEEDKYERDGPMMEAVDERVARMAADKARRHFMWLHFVAPHEPYIHHDGVKPFGRKALDRYDGEIRYFDTQLGRLVDGLREGGLLDDTLVVLVADHGEAFGEHGKRKHGHTLFEEDVRIPCLVRAPGGEPHVVDGPGAIVDVVPTVMDLLGLPRPADLDGVSWAATVDDGTPLPRRSIVVRRVRVGILRPRAHAVIRDNKKTLFTPELDVAGSWLLDDDPHEKNRVDDPALADEHLADLQAFLDEMP
jgi:arylsulfatase A-like enzyme